MAEGHNHSILDGSYGDPRDMITQCCVIRWVVHHQTLINTDCLRLLYGKKFEWNMVNAMFMAASWLLIP